jgi:hypothetical protein
MTKQFLKLFTVGDVIAVIGGLMVNIVWGQFDPIWTRTLLAQGWSLGTSNCRGCIAKPRITSASTGTTLSKPRPQRSNRFEENHR